MGQGESILIVDDDQSTCGSLTLIFGQEGYETETARTGREALRRAQRRFFNLALVDIKLPDVEGIELIARLKGINPDLAVTMITAYASLETAVEALNKGASAYIMKPLNMHEVLVIVREALEKQRLFVENHRLCQAAGRELAERKQTAEELRKNLEGLRRIFNETVRALASAVEMREPYLAGHQERVTTLAVAMARKLSLPEDQIDGLCVAGLVHDVGKLFIPTEILGKSGELTLTERETIKTHPKVGYDILKTIEFPWPVAEVVRQHHERLNGSGYPRGLAGENILLEARILSVADVVEAVSYPRPHRPPLGIDKALEVISESRDLLHDAEVVEVCFQLFREKGFRFE